MSDKDMNNISEEDVYKKIKEYAEDIEVPKELSPKNIEKKLEGADQQMNDGRRSSFRKPLAIAASFAVVLAVGALAVQSAKLYSDGSGFDGAAEEAMPMDDVIADTTATDSPIDESSGGVAGAELSYEEVCSIINSYNDKNFEKYGLAAENTEGTAAVEDAADGATGTVYNKTSDVASSQTGSPSSKESSDYSTTDEQVKGVAEGDIIKTDGRHIFTIEEDAFGYKVHIIEPDGNFSNEVNSISFKEATCREMYIYDDYLITIEDKWSTIDDVVDNSDEDIQYNYVDGALRNRYSDTIITITDISDVMNLKTVSELSQSGTFATSRISDGFLYTFSEKRYDRRNYVLESVEDYIPLVGGKPIEEDRIVRATSEDTNDFMIITSVSLSDPREFTDEVSALGGYATYYVSNNNIYIAKSEYEIDDPKSTITRFSYKNGQINKEASSKVRAVISDSYYMHEYQGNLIFVYMRYDFKSSDEVNNGLCILDSNLDPLGELKNIAPNEEIYASYYIENMAYFVTYRNTDPVFAVDISDPSDPKLMSKLKLPGYSSYMHSFGEGQLIGIGYGQAKGDEWDETTKISLFGIGEDYTLSEKYKTFLSNDASNWAGSDHRVVYVDEERGIVGFAVYEYDEKNDKEFARYVVYKQKSDKLVKVLSKKIKIIDEDGNYVSYTDIRGIRIDDQFYICDRQGVIAAYGYDTGAKWMLTK